MTSAIVQAQRMLIESLLLLEICYRGDIPVDPDPPADSAERIGQLKFARGAQGRVI